ncbi:unnamed protein product, partial [marine sediment metagenome]
GVVVDGRRATYQFLILTPRPIVETRRGFDMELVILVR